jgi:hypothetical protein
MLQGDIGDEQEESTLKSYEKAGFIKGKDGMGDQISILHQ